MSKLYFRICCFMLFFVAASASFSGFYEKWHFREAGVRGDDQRFSFESMVEGTAYRPYVFRQMLPEIANLVDRAVPSSVKDWLYRNQGRGPSAYMALMAISPTAANRVYFFRYLVLYTFTFLFALLAAYAMYGVCHALKLHEAAAVFSPVIVLLIIPYIQNVGGYFYDFPELALLAMAIWIALRFDWWWIIPVAALGAWNKETFVLVILSLYPLIRIRNSRIKALIAVAILCVVCFTVSYPIRLQFAHNPGAAVGIRLSAQLHSLLHPRKLTISTVETYGVRGLRAYTLFPMAMLIWSVCRAWGLFPRPMRQHALIAAAINIPLYFLFCQPGELRDLSLLYVVLLLVIAVNLNRWIGGSKEPEADPQALALLSVSPP